MLKRFIIVVKERKLMIIYLFGLLDILAGISLLLLKFNVDFYGLFFAIYLIIKGIVFIRYLASIADMVAGLMLLYAIYTGHFAIINYAAIIWLVQKGSFSFMKVF